MTKLWNHEPLDPQHKCKDHEWVSIANEKIESGEMCLTCYQNGETDIPIRSAQLNVKKGGE